LVDDDAVSLELMALLLAHEGHQVLRANDADAALELLTEDHANRPDVMLVDLQMPGVSGGQLAERIRALGIPKPLLLAMSATAVQRRQLPVFDGFLLKPLVIDDLRKALDPKAAHPRKRSLRTLRPAPPADVPLDFTVVRKLLAMMPVGALHETVAACLEDARASIEIIRKSLGNDVRVRHYAHRIKGAAAMIGANHLANLAGGLEAGGDKGAATLHVLDDLVKACNELERMLFAGKFSNTQGPHDNHSHPSDS
jgi:CheY-like chemotaxis protein/HPt (histidine-containing phosphotransfer) domain-containing protein